MERRVVHGAQVEVGLPERQFGEHSVCRLAGQGCLHG
jgi:hypothetical protein